MIIFLLTSAISIIAQQQAHPRVASAAIVQREGIIQQLATANEQALLLYRDALFVLDLRFQVANGVAAKRRKLDGQAALKCPDADLPSNLHIESRLHRTTNDVILQQPASEIHALLMWRNALFVLDRLLDVLDGVEVARGDVERFCPAR